MTSGSSSQPDGERSPAQALAPPLVLTHLIEGFVIQEGAEPFPVERPSFSMDGLRRHTADPHRAGGPAQGNAGDTRFSRTRGGQQDSGGTAGLWGGQQDFGGTAGPWGDSRTLGRTHNGESSSQGDEAVWWKWTHVVVVHTDLLPLEQDPGACWEGTESLVCPSELEAQKEPLLTCELCGKVDLAQVFKRSKRFCSTVCAKRQCSDLSGYDRPPSPLGASPLSFLPSEPQHWNIEEVYEFIASLPGCLDFAEQFRGQEIDGQALLLLEEDHLMGTMNIKLGPALKICAQISSLRDS
ncbi:Polyhomeotic-like protein 2 [Liparis tanakae]|uniref:Polyhomeotic-like protein 2 n=1 Tax=Liparis tanakae TaxID=230148 RepID=A0A4Z2GZJ7_9TELE|nr:Polyhomeotic-like protein 2 [Liparis tanakae]